MDVDVDFDYDRIPDDLIHDVVHETLGDRMLTGGTNGSAYNFRCPICGDSKKNPLATRGYVLYKKGWAYHCHNECGSMSFFSFLKNYHSEQYRRLIFHAFKNPSRTKKQVVDNRTEAEKTFNGTESYNFKKGELISIQDDHPSAKEAINYCISRKIPRLVYSRWFVCLRDNKFRDYVDGNYVLNDKGKPTGNEYGNRIIIPYYRYGGKWVQFDARDLNPNSKLRYRNLEAAEREMYNVDFLNVNEPFFLFEGAIDSTFIRNSVGFGGTKHLMRFLKENPHILKNCHNGTVVWDDDEAGHDEMPRTSKMGFNWFDWSNIKPLPEYKYYIDKDGVQRERQIKDMNDAVLYTDAFKYDSDGFITYDSVKKYIKKADGVVSSVQLMIRYGNREKKRKAKNKQIAEQMKLQAKKNEIKVNF